MNWKFRIVITMNVVILHKECVLHREMLFMLFILNIVFNMICFELQNCYIRTCLLIHVIIDMLYWCIFKWNVGSVLSWIFAFSCIKSTSMSYYLFVFLYSMIMLHVSCSLYIKYLTVFAEYTRGLYRVSILCQKRAHQLLFFFFFFRK